MVIVDKLHRRDMGWGENIFTLMTLLNPAGGTAPTTSANSNPTWPCLNAKTLLERLSPAWATPLVRAETLLTVRIGKRLNELDAAIGDVDDEEHIKHQKH